MIDKQSQQEVEDLVGEIDLIYDSHCPACDYYCHLVKIRESLGPLNLIDTRDNPDILQQITARGWDIDEGMVLRVADQLYYGSEAIHLLSLLGTSSGLFNRLNFWIFKSAQRADICYPLLRACMGLLLKILRRSRINNLEIEGKDRF